tara:strand:+ start:3127 stop:3324 length:198 start_codon:yes stop_codon:yes gene_type:complete
MKKMKKYGMGGPSMANSIVSGKAGNSVQSFDSPSQMNTGRERMQAYAKGGGLMGYMEGGDVMDVY